MKNTTINTLFLDVGGVLLTNGWDHTLRKRAAETFKLDFAEMESRHHLTFDTYESGKLTLEDYLNRIVFYQPRTFTKENFIEFMLGETKPYTDTIDMIRKMKELYKLKVVVVSNEGRELTQYRIEQFKLMDFVDFYIASSFVHLRKPDTDIYQLALDLAQTEPEQVIYIDDRLMFVEIAKGMGINGIHHTNVDVTYKALQELIESHTTV